MQCRAMPAPSCNTYLICVTFIMEDDRKRKEETFPKSDSESLWRQGGKSYQIFDLASLLSYE
jgi:hypothetical protein